MSGACLRAASMSAENLTGALSPSDAAAALVVVSPLVVCESGEAHLDWPLDTQHRVHTQNQF